LTNQHLIA